MTKQLVAKKGPGRSVVAIRRPSVVYGTDTRIDRDATDSFRISIRHGYDSSDREKSRKHAPRTNRLFP